MRRKYEFGITGSAMRRQKLQLGAKKETLVPVVEKTRPEYFPVEKGISQAPAINNPMKKHLQYQENDQTPLELKGIAKEDYSIASNKVDYLAKPLIDFHVNDDAHIMQSSVPNILRRARQVVTERQSNGVSLCNVVVLLLRFGSLYRTVNVTNRFDLTTYVCVKHISSA